LKYGGLLAHNTGTLAGVAASPFNPLAMQRLVHFKQRHGPFLLLADSIRTAFQLAIYIPTALRSEMQQAWPGPTSIIFPCRPSRITGLSRKNCYAGRRIAVRVDSDADCRYLAAQNGGLLASSSLNRKNQRVQTPDKRLQMRLHRHLNDALTGANGSGIASQIVQWKNRRLHVLRPANKPTLYSP